MTRLPRIARFATGLGLLLGAAAPLGAATFQGHEVDGHRYHGSIVNYDYGAYTNLEFQFHGDQVFVYFPAGGRLVLILQEEEIQNPHDIHADDPRRGIVWEMNVHDMIAH